MPSSLTLPRFDCYSKPTPSARAEEASAPKAGWSKLEKLALGLTIVGAVALTVATVAAVVLLSPSAAAFLAPATGFLASGLGLIGLSASAKLVALVAGSVGGASLIGALAAHLFGGKPAAPASPVKEDAGSSEPRSV